MRLVAHLLAAVSIAACTSSPAVTPPGPALRLAAIGGFKRPEGARWDADQRVWFISSINGPSGEKDNNGFITRLAADGSVDSLQFIAGGRDGVTLNAPKGMALAGDTLWVADLDAVRGFHRKTGASLATVNLSGLGALFLNDITVGPGGALYLTDTGVRFDSAGTRNHTGPDRVYRISDGRPSVALEGDWLGQPNGITYDTEGRRFLLAPVAGDSSVQEWREGQPRAEPVARGAGRYDGIEVLPGGRVVLSVWNDSTISEVAGKEIRPLIRNVPSAADIGVDPVAGVVAVPVLGEDRVELWRLPR